MLSLLRPGKRPTGNEAARILKPVIRRIRRHWPRVEITVRIAVRIEELKARVKIALPSAYPYQKALVAMAGCIAAQGP